MSSNQSHSGGDFKSIHRKNSVPNLEAVPVFEGDIKILKTIHLNNDGLCCQFSKDGKKLAVGLADGTVKVFKSSSGSPLYHLPAPVFDKKVEGNMSVAVTTLHFIPPDVSPRGELLVVTYSGGLVQTWHIATQEVLKSINEQRQVLASGLAPSKKQFLTGGSTEQLIQYDVETGMRTHVFEPSQNREVMDGHRYRVFSIKYHPANENIFLSGGWDNTVQIWDSREEHAIRRISGPHICGDGIDIEPRYDHVLTSSWRRSDVLQIWDFNSGDRIRTVPADYSGGSMLYCGQWLGNKHIICGGAEHNQIRIINKTTLETAGIITNLPAGVYSVDHDRARLASHPNIDVTMLAAVAGPSVYLLSNAPIPKKDGE